MDWLGHASIRLTHAATPLDLPLKDGTRTDLVRICERAVPPCRLNPLLFNGHLQTMWTSVKAAGPPVHYRRRILQADHKRYVGSFAVDFVVPPHDDADDALPPRTGWYDDQAFSDMAASKDSGPMLIVLHGLSGGSYEIYLRHAIAPLMADAQRWHICVVNSRGCANSEVTSGVLFNARATWDVRQVVKWARDTFPNRPLFALGFSLGANILTNYLGEEGSRCVLKGAVAVANPFNLDVADKALRRTWLGLDVYQRFMGNNLKKLINKHRESFLKYTNLDFDKIQRIKYLYEFDREVQTKCWGYPTEEAYYRDASSSDAVLNIRIPFLAINALDDPIAVREALPYPEIRYNPYTVLCTTSLGGHLSWFEMGGSRWHSKPIANFLTYMASEVDLEAMEPFVNWTKNFAGTDFDPVRRKMFIDID